MEVPLLLVDFTDGRGERQTRLAVRIGEEVRFFAKDALGKPAQEWLAKKIFEKMEG